MRPLTRTRLRVWVINADNYRGPAVAYELRSVANVHRPEVIAVVEATGNPTPRLDGYQRVADDSTPGRGNIVAYVRDDLEVTAQHWVDAYLEWPRTEGPGQHPARAFLVLRIGGRTRVIIAHQPPPGATLSARAEHLRLLADACNGVPDWPLIVAWDGNGAGPRLAELIDGRVRGRRVDQLVVRDVGRVIVRYVRSWRGSGGHRVRFGGDHRHVARCTVWVPRSHLTRRPTAGG